MLVKIMEATTTPAGHLITYTGKIIGHLLQSEFTAHKRSTKTVHNGGISLPGSVCVKLC